MTLGLGGKSVSDLINEFAKLSEGMPADKLAELDRQLIAASNGARWVPFPGPQLEAVKCEADELFYGGSAGSAKTDLCVGLSLTKHKRSLILRRTNKEASKLVERYVEILGGRDGFNGQEGCWHLPDGRVIDISGCQHEDDKQKFKGTPHDLIAFDEAADFSESQFRFITTWNRSSDPTQRCRVVAAGNPPTTPEGLWVIKYWAPWLDTTHPHPAQPGEIRWFTTIAGKDTEVDGPGPHLVDGDMVRARSRSFIRGKLSDNPILSATNYASVLSALPEELRAAYRDGRFDAALRDAEYQVIPTQHIIAAQERWKRSGGRPPPGTPMVACGLDVAAGGSDETTLAMRYDAWYAPLIVVPGSETPMGSDCASLVVRHRRDGAVIVVDVGGGYGGAVIQTLRENNISPVGFNGAGASGGRRTNDGARLGFANRRAECWWRFREALNPDQPGGSPIELPDDPTLRADLASPRWKLVGRGIQIEDKLEIKKRLGRSPDRGDAVVMAWDQGQSALRESIRARSGSHNGSANRSPRQAYANMGYADIKKKQRGWIGDHRD